MHAPAQPRLRAAASPAAAPMPVTAPDAGIASDAVDEKQLVASDGLFAADDDRLIVVRCDVTTQAEAETALRGLLATNQIAWEPYASDAEPETRNKRAVAPQEKSAGNARAPAQQAAPGEPDVADAVYVLADRAQLQTTIDTLTASRAFRNVRFERVDAAAEGRKPKNWIRGYRQTRTN